MIKYEAIGIDKEILFYELCYVKDDIAWFTSDWKHQWGKNWRESEYYKNSSEPYDTWYDEVDDEIVEHPIKLFYCYIEPTQEMKEPYQRGVELSVKDINEGACPWIMSDDFVIAPKTTFNDFVELFVHNNGVIHIPTKIDSIEEDKNYYPWREEVENGISNK